MNMETRSSVFHHEHDNKVVLDIKCGSLTDQRSESPVKLGLLADCHYERLWRRARQGVINVPRSMSRG